jgi:hypothetical protein
VNELNKKLLLQLGIGIALVASGFYLVLLKSVWCINWLLDAIQAIVNDPLIVITGREALVLDIALVITGAMLLIVGLWALLTVKKAET